jgi:hypothetical protein
LWTAPWSPPRDHSIAEQSKNYRYSTNHQVVIDADTRLVVAVGRPLPGNRNDCKAWELSGAKAAVGRTTVIADGGYRGTDQVPHRRTPGQAGQAGLERGAQPLTPQGPRPHRARLRPHEDLEDPPRLPPQRRRRPPRHARQNRPGLEERAHAATDGFHAEHVPHRVADWGRLLTAAGFTVEDERTLTVDIEGGRSEAIGRYAHGSLQRIRGVAAPVLDPQDLAALGELLDTDGPNSILHRTDLAVRTERTVWAARRA